MIKMVWFPTWKCINYDKEKSHSHNCPYCPYGFKDEWLLYENKKVSPQGYVEPKDMIDFLVKHRAVLGNFIEISGGEPLMYNGLIEVLKETGFYWAITTNGRKTEVVRDMITEGLFNRCVAFNMSYHPCSNADNDFRKTSELIFNYTGGQANSTVVVSQHTIGMLQHAKDFLSTVPLQAIHYHHDAHSELPEWVDVEAEKIIGKVPYLAGDVPKNVMCRKNNNLMAISPTGDVFHCVTKCYLNKDSIGNVKDIDIIPNNKAELCDVGCFACSDWIKHEENKC